MEHEDEISRDVECLEERAMTEFSLKSDSEGNADEWGDTCDSKSRCDWHLASGNDECKHDCHEDVHTETVGDG